MVIILKHSQTFQDIIVNVDKIEGNTVLENGIQSISAISVSDPLIIIPQQDQSGGIRVGLAPFSFNMRDDQKIILDTSHFVTAFEAGEEMEKLYLRHTSSIEIATAMPSRQ